MAIANAVQKGSLIYLYDEKGRSLASVPAFNGLVGFTSTTVSVRSGGVIYMYNERGVSKGAIQAR